MGINVTAFGLRVLKRHTKGKEKGKGKITPLGKRLLIAYRVFYDVNRIGKSKVVTYIPILLGPYRQPHLMQPFKIALKADLCMCKTSLLKYP